VRLARDQSRREEDVPQLDLTSTGLPDSRTTVDQALAQQAIGERFLSLLGALAISSPCASSKLLIMSDDHDLASEVRSGLAEYFGVTSAGVQFERFVSQLAREFYRWVKTHPREARAFGLEFDARGRIFLDRPDVRVDLEPLTE
jgi:hypothetical protein